MQNQQVRVSEERLHFYHCGGPLFYFLKINADIVHTT